MSETAIQYDEHAFYEITWTKGALQEIGGRGLDDFCDSNAACFNRTDEYCINTNMCMNDVGCIENVGCS